VAVAAAFTFVSPRPAHDHRGAILAVTRSFLSASTHSGSGGHSRQGKREKQRTERARALCILGGMRWRVYLQLVKAAARGWIRNRAPSMGAALAFYSAFTMAPLLIIAIGITGAIFGEQAARGAIDTQLTSVVGPTAAAAIKSLLTAAHSKPHGLLASVVGIVTVLVGATTVMVELQNDLDRIWGAPPRAGAGMMVLVRSHALSLGIVLGIGFLLLLSLVFTAILTMFTKKYGHAFPGFSSMLYAIHFVLSLTLVTSLIAILYKWLPNVAVAWREVWVGALTTAVLFQIGQIGIGLYLTHSAIASAYGAAGAMVVLLLWLYYSAQIFLFGAEFTHAFAARSDALGMSPLSADGARLNLTERAST
jgi:membrane protein